MVQRLGAFCALLCLTALTLAAPADMPAGSTGLCNDGSYSNSATKRGACRGHKGVKEWYAAAADTADTAKKGGPAATSKSTSTATERTALPAPAATPAPAPVATTPAMTPAPAPPPRPAPSAHTTATSGKSVTPATAAAGGGPGMVWVNADTKVYHCSGARWYGKTKQGSYMSEAEAKSQGARPSGGKACS